MMWGIIKKRQIQSPANRWLSQMHRSRRMEKQPSTLHCCCRRTTVIGLHSKRQPVRKHRTTNFRKKTNSAERDMNKISCSVGYHRCTVSNGSYVRFRIPSKIRFCNSENQHHKQNLTHSTATPATVFTGKIALLNMYVNRYRAILKEAIST